MNEVLWPRNRGATSQSASSRSCKYGDIYFVTSFIQLIQSESMQDTVGSLLRSVIFLAAHNCYAWKEENDAKVEGIREPKMTKWRLCGFCIWCCLMRICVNDYTTWYYTFTPKCCTSARKFDMFVTAWVDQWTSGNWANKYCVLLETFQNGSLWGLLCSFSFVTTLVLRAFFWSFAHFVHRYSSYSFAKVVCFLCQTTHGITHLKEKKTPYYNNKPRFCQEYFDKGEPLAVCIQTKIFPPTTFVTIQNSTGLHHPSAHVIWHSWTHLCTLIRAPSRNAQTWSKSHKMINVEGGSRKRIAASTHRFSKTRCLCTHFCVLMWVRVSMRFCQKNGMAEYLRLRIA